MKKKSLLEEILTPKQLEWVRKNKFHPKMLDIHVIISERTSTSASDFTGHFTIMPNEDDIVKTIREKMEDLKKWLELEGIK